MKQDNSKDSNQRPAWLNKIIGKNAKQDPLETSLSDSSRTLNTANLDEFIRSGLNASTRAKLSEGSKNKTHVEAVEDQRSKITTEEMMWYGM